MPFRHTRAKAALMLSGATELQMRQALTRLIFGVPDKVLDALCEVMDD